MQRDTLCTLVPHFFFHFFPLHFFLLQFRSEQSFIFASSFYKLCILFLQLFHYLRSRTTLSLSACLPFVSRSCAVRLYAQFLSRPITCLLSSSVLHKDYLTHLHSCSQFLSKFWKVSTRRGLSPNLAETVQANC